MDGRSRDPRRGRLALELLTLGLMGAGLAGTVALIVLAYRKPATGPVAAPPPPILSIAEPAPVAAPPPPILITIPTVDLTNEQVAAARRDRDELARRELELRARRELLESARSSAAEQARAAAERSMAKQRQAALLAADAERLVVEAELLGMEVDVLERRQEDAAAIANRPAGFAVVPYRGPSGTWRRPIAVECLNGGAHLPPNGPTFSLIELGALQGPGTPFVTSLIRLSAHLKILGAPDGAEVTPYVLFVVRPDGIRPFYEARSRVEELGMPYGYELVAQDEPIEFPAIDDPTIWGEITAIRERGLAQIREAGARATLSQAMAAAERGESLGEAFPPAPPSADQITAPRSLGDLIAEDPGLAEAFGEAGQGAAHPLEAPLSGTVSGRPGAMASPTVAGDFGQSPAASLSSPSSSRPTDVGRSPIGSEVPPLDAPPIASARPMPPQSGATGSSSGSGDPAALGALPADQMLEITVVCARKGLVIHPGAYRLTNEMIKKQPDRLVQTLRSLVTARESAAPGRRIWPSVRFLVEPEGEETYWKARQVVALDLPEWPTEWHVAEPRTFTPFGKERW